MTFAGAGEACGIINAKFVSCAANGKCRPGANPLQGTCVAAAADGAPCDETAGPLCTPPAICVSGLCKLGDPALCK
jgi:hypothetical protein